MIIITEQQLLNALNASIPLCLWDNLPEQTKAKYNDYIQHTQTHITLTAKGKEHFNFTTPHVFTCTHHDAHTAHCDAIAGCKYGEEDICMVWLGYAKQERGYWDGEKTHPIPELPHETYVKRREESDSSCWSDELCETT